MAFFRSSSLVTQSINRQNWESAEHLLDADVVPLQQGDAVVFTVNQRPAQGKRAATRKVARCATASAGCAVGGAIPWV